MTIVRRELVDVSVTPWYHCITRCVRRALLLGEGLLDRKQWVEDRIEELAKIFAVDVGGFSVMDNHLHLLVRLDPEIATDWSDDEVVRRWGSLYRTRQRGSKRPKPAVWRVPVRRGAWKTGSGSARSRIDAGWTHHDRACLRDCRSAIISSFWTIPGGCFARARPRYRRIWLAFSIGLEVTPRAGKCGWKSSRMADRSAVSLRLAGRSCEPWPLA